MLAKRCSLTLLALFLLASTTLAEEVRGIIIKADADKKELTIEGRGKGVRGATLRFVFDKDTQILAGRKPATIADLATGKRVRVVFEEQRGQRKALLLTLPALALTTAEPAPPASVATDANSVAGTLRRVAFTDRELVVIHTRPQGGAEVETTVVVPEDAKIARDQKAIRFEDLKEGEQALVQTEQRDGQLVAKSVQVGTKGSPAMLPKDDRKIERLRQVLKMLDSYLQMMERK